MKKVKFKKKQLPDGIEISQSNADMLIAMPKHYFGDDKFDFPHDGKELHIPILSIDKRYEFILDITSKSIAMKYTFQNRFRNTVHLVRIDICPGFRHRNPDETLIVGNHIHHYRAGYGDRWAVSLSEKFSETNDSDPIEICHCFFDYCHVETKPVFIPTLLKYEND